jgi:hypothetical protein
MLARTSLTIALLGLLGWPDRQQPSTMSRSGRYLLGHPRMTPPHVDSGSIRSTQVAPGQNGAYTTSINGFGASELRCRQPLRSVSTLKSCGFGLHFDVVAHFNIIQPVNMGGVTITFAAMLTSLFMANSKLR